MKCFLVTGLIGSGKSEVSRILVSQGFPVYDSDSRTKALYGREELAYKIRKEVGLKISELGKVFSDEEKLRKLEAIVHPEVLEDFRKFALESGSELVFFESAIALDKPLFRSVFDGVILVRASQQKRFERNPKARSRSAFQTETEDWDYLVENEGSLEELEEKVNSIIETIKREI